jgi:hypothetical protein
MPLKAAITSPTASTVNLYPAVITLSRNTTADTIITSNTEEPDRVTTLLENLRIRTLDCFYRDRTKLQEFLTKCKRY